MKMTSRVALAGVLLLTATGVPLWAQSDAETKNQEQAVPVAKNEPAASDSAVRIDNTGIHVGGEEPVDIKLPDMQGHSGFLGPLLPIISVLTVFGAPVAVVALFVFLRHRRNRMLHETLRAMVEKGVPIPPELIARGGMAPAVIGEVRPGYRDLRWGLVLVALGGGLFIVAGKFAFIPLFIGVALIAVWAIGMVADKRKKPMIQ
jgi:hypothetical protein